MKNRDIILNTEVHRPMRDSFVASLNAACRREGWREGEAFRRFVEAAFRSMRGATLKITTPDRWEENEQEYLKIAAGCQPESLTDIANMLGATTWALETEPTDFLGPLHSALAANAGLGQFFTPHHLASLMAMVTAGDPPADGSCVHWEEPACGVGGMVLSTTQVLIERGFNIPRGVHWRLTDVDFVAMAGCYIQVNLCGISADVVWGDTLALSERMSTPTLIAALFPKRPKLTQAESMPQPEPTPAPMPTGQLSLF